MQDSRCAEKVAGCGKIIFIFLVNKRLYHIGGSNFSRTQAYAKGYFFVFFGQKGGCTPPGGKIWNGAALPNKIPQMLYCLGRSIPAHLHAWVEYFGRCW